MIQNLMTLFIMIIVIIIIIIVNKIIYFHFFCLWLYHLNYDTDPVEELRIYF